MIVITKKDSTIIKGFAILMMIIHHAWNSQLIGNISIIPGYISSDWLFNTITSVH